LRESVSLKQIFGFDVFVGFFVFFADAAVHEIAGRVAFWRGVSVEA